MTDAKYMRPGLDFATGKLVEQRDEWSDAAMLRKIAKELDRLTNRAADDSVTSADTLRDIANRLAAHPDTPKAGPDAEPVAWMYKRHSQVRVTDYAGRYYPEVVVEQSWTEIPLYAHPPAQDGPNAGEVERVARAIYEEDDPWHKVWPWPNLSEKQASADQYRDIARAAIAAKNAYPPDSSVERVAQAINAQMDFTHTSETWQDTARRYARAAIAATPEQEAIRLMQAYYTADDARNDCPECENYGPWEECGPCSERIGEAINDQLLFLAAMRTPPEAGERYLSGRFQWAAPGDQQEDVWLLRFCDNDVRDLMWTGPEAEVEAWAAWNSHAPGYNCYLLHLARLSPPAQDGQSPVEGVQLSGWRPIETVPKDGTPVDLWVRPWSGQAHRCPNYWWLGSEQVWRTDLRADDLSKRWTPTHWKPLDRGPDDSTPPEAQTSAAGEDMLRPALDAFPKRLPDEDIFEWQHRVIEWRETVEDWV